MIPHLLFDLDGTLTDPRVGITRCIQYALNRIGQSPYNESELIKFIGPPIHSTFEKVLGTSDKDLIEQAIYFYRERFSEVGFLENRLYPGIIKLLTALYENSCKLYVVTNKPKVYADKIIRHFSIAHWFSEVFGPTLDEHLVSKTKLVSLALVNCNVIYSVSNWHQSIMNEARTLLQLTTESKSTYSLVAWLLSPFGPKTSVGILKYCTY